MSKFTAGNDLIQESMDAHYEEISSRPPYFVLGPLRDDGDALIEEILHIHTEFPVFLGMHDGKRVSTGIAALAPAWRTKDLDISKMRPYLIHCSGPLFYGHVPVQVEEFIRDDPHDWFAQTPVGKLLTLMTRPQFQDKASFLWKFPLERGEFPVWKEGMLRRPDFEAPMVWYVKFPSSWRYRTALAYRSEDAKAGKLAGIDKEEAKEYEKIIEKWLAELRGE